MTDTVSPDRYLGDGVYARHDGWQVWLRAERDGATHEVALEPDTIKRLKEWVDALYAQYGVESPLK